MNEDRELLFTEFFNQKLKERGLNLRQLSEMSGISMKYLESFAHGRFENLPPTPYLHGYFVRLGGILGFDAEEWWKRIREEEPVPTSGVKDILPKNRYSIRRTRFLLPAGIIVILLVVYLGLRFTKILGQPSLDVTYPQEDSIRTQENHIIVAGTVKNADEVDVNAEQVPLDGQNFQKDIPLQPGLNTIEITAKKLLGRETTVTKQVYYQASDLEMLRPEAPSSTPISTTTGRGTSSSTGTTSTQP